MATEVIDRDKLRTSHIVRNWTVYVLLMPVASVLWLFVKVSPCVPFRINISHRRTCRGTGDGIRGGEVLALLKKDFISSLLQKRNEVNYISWSPPSIPEHVSVTVTSLFNTACLGTPSTHNGVQKKNLSGDPTHWFSLFQSKKSNEPSRFYSLASTFANLPPWVF